MVEESEVQNRLAALANGQMSIDDFAEWIEANSWNMHADSPAVAVEIVSSIHLLLSEYDNGDWSESGLRAELLKQSRTGRA